ncbi:MAG: SAM-dependent methyltransferase [Chloroflexota bacterium]
MSKYNRLGASFRDPSGFLFSYKGEIYRQINQSYQEDFNHLIESGLYDNLVQSGMLITHQEVDLEPPQREVAYKIIKPQRLLFISYPYEWCFSQLKDAALLTLEIQKRALKHGLSLKDSSAYNIQFHHGRPILIDSLSFERYIEERPWVAYRQFCQHFLAPLSLMAFTDVRLSQLLRVQIDGIPLDLASKLLPWKTWFNFSLLTNIHLHAAAQARYADEQINLKSTEQKMGLTSLLGLIDSLETSIRNLKWSPKDTTWGDYSSFHNYTPAAIDHKRQILNDYLEKIHPTSVYDLGANVGTFSRLASTKGIPTLAFDFDPGAVEINYLQCLQEGETNLLPLLMDLTNPSPGIGWQNEERLSLMARSSADAVLALALIHHLLISNNLPFEHLASFFAQLGRWLVIEYIPKSDPQAQKLLASREDIFLNYTPQVFESVFSERYKIHHSTEIHESDRILYLMERK